MEACHRCFEPLERRQRTLIEQFYLERVLYCSTCARKTRFVRNGLRRFFSPVGRLLPSHWSEAQEPIDVLSMRILPIRVPETMNLREGALDADFHIERVPSTARELTRQLIESPFADTYADAAGLNGESLESNAEPLHVHAVDELWASLDARAADAGVAADSAVAASVVDGPAVDRAAVGASAIDDAAVDASAVDGAARPAAIVSEQRAETFARSSTPSGERSRSDAERQRLEALLAAFELRAANQRRSKDALRRSE